jgi:hypothetical protein
MGTETEHLYMKTWPLDGNHEPKLRKPESLKPWQTLGVVFLHYCRKKFHCALLCDEPGIGKVIQITTIETNSVDPAEPCVYLWYRTGESGKVGIRSMFS